MRWILLVGALFLGPSLFAQEEVVVACQPGLEAYYPLVRGVYARLGLSCRFSVMPSERALAEVNAGEVDAEIGRTENLRARYPGIVYSTEPLVRTGLIGWVLKGSTTAIDEKDGLQRLRVGILRGNKSAEAFAQEHQLRTEVVVTVDALSKMLIARRIDLILMPRATESEVLESVASPIEVGAPQYQVFHLFSQKRADLVERWDSALRQMKSDGSYTRLVK